MKRASLLLLLLVAVVALTLTPLVAAASGKAAAAPAPSYLTGEEAGKRAVALHWGQVTGATQYAVYKNGAKVATTKKSAVTIKHLRPDVVYSFKVRAKVGDEYGAASYAITAKGKRTNARQTRNVQSLRLNKASLTIGVGLQGKLKATLRPATKLVSTAIVWTTSDASVATVDDGRVTAEGPGECLVFARSHNGMRAKCVVVVEPSATTKTGTYVGRMNDGIEEYLGIRYGHMEPFKAPLDLTTTTADVIKAQQWGENSIQPWDAVEVASQDPCSQDCLFLNVWTKDSDTKGKPVIFWVHGGGYVWGGSTDPMYDGEQFVRHLANGEDCVFVTINYRLHFLGSADLSVLDGYTDEYRDALNLAKLDQTKALKWVYENVEAFGGNRDNITIMGHSSGGAAVSQLMADPYTSKYIDRCIEHSGVPFYVIISEEQCKERSQQVFDILGVDSVAELTALTDEQISAKMTEINENVDLGGVVADGRIISKTWWDDLRDGSAADVELLIGGTSGEFDYGSMDWENFPNPVADYLPRFNQLKQQEDEYAGIYGRYSANEAGVVDDYLALGDDKVMLMQDISNDLLSAYGSEMIAEEQSKHNRDTYIYYWEYSPSKEDVIAFSGDSAEVSPWSRPLHSMDVLFAFGTLEDGYLELSGDPTKLDSTLSPETQAAWYNFAKTGNPSNNLTGTWKKYNASTRYTMDITPEGEWLNVKDFRADRYDVLKAVRPFGER